MVTANRQGYFGKSKVVRIKTFGYQICKTTKPRREAIAVDRRTALFKSGPGGEGRGGMRNSGAAADRGCGGSGDRWRGRGRVPTPKTLTPCSK